VFPRLALLAALCSALIAPSTSCAQSSNGEVVPSDTTTLKIRAARRDTIRATSTVTAAFTVSNASDENVSVMPHVEMPKDWTILMGGSALPVGGRSSEMFMLSVVVPARAAAGIYAVRVWITTSRDPEGVMDSVVVRIPERRALEITMLDRPGFVVSGRNYQTTFQIRNRGNSPAELRVTARTSMSVPGLSDTIFTLAPDETRLVKATALTRAGLQSAADDVLELSAQQQGGDDAEPTQSSVRVTIVPEPTRKIEEFLRFPVLANLRASNGGVSPYEIMGAGYVLDGNGIRADFLARGSPGASSAFGERDEYRLNLAAPHWQARFGDNFYMLSQLTGGSQPGVGASLSGDRGRFSAGGYAQQFRRAPEGGTETGAFLGAELVDGARMAVNAVTRSRGLTPANVASATATLSRDIYHGDFELARSSASSTGMARAARFGVSASRFSVDLGHNYADTTFAGAQRGAHHNYVTSNVAALPNVSFGMNASRHETDLSRATGVPYVENLDIGMLSATFFEVVTVELNGLTRGTTISGISASGRQRGVRARGDLQTPVAQFSLEAEGGRSTDAALVKRRYSDVTVNARRGFGRGSAAMWTSHYSGGSITKGEDGAVTVGGDATLRAGASTNVTLMGYATRPEITGQGWHSQLDVLASRSLRNGASITLRARMMGEGGARADQTVAFLEYGMPLRLPVSRLRTRGRVHGRVVDAVTGSGVPGALVRLGPQVAITDNDGEVAFGGVPAGEHRLSMSQETSFADAVFVGDPTLNVDSNRTQPTEFRLAIARSARVNISVRRFVARQTAIAPASRDSTAVAQRDSLVDAGPLANATLVLTGERDTLYRTTGENGAVSFTDVPPGAWTIAIRGDAPAYHRFDPDRLELVLKPGETQAVAFRLIPRRREIQIIGAGQELKSTTGDTKSATSNSTVRTVKPEEKKDRQQ
jgi:hypothetical protein